MTIVVRAAEPHEFRDAANALRVTSTIASPSDESRQLNLPS